MPDADPLLPGAAWLPTVEALAAALRACGGRVATAESCTGGLIGAACTHLAGSSDWYDRGWVTYSNEAKTELLGVPAELIARHGAVSAEVAQAMAEGALARSRATFAVAVTGIAGPGGATPGKPVGLVWRGLAWRGPDGGVRAEALSQVFDGDRAEVRGVTVQWALSGLLALATGR